MIYLKMTVLYTINQKTVIRLAVAFFSKLNQRISKTRSLEFFPIIKEVSTEITFFYVQISYKIGLHLSNQSFSRL